MTGLYTGLGLTIVGTTVTPTPSPTPTPTPGPTPSDTTAPILTNATSSQTGQTTATIGVTTDEGNGALYFFVSTSNTAPSAANLKAGTGAVTSGALSITSAGTKSQNLTGLTAATQYYTHWLHRDAAGNDSAILTGPGFTTAAAVPTFGAMYEPEAVSLFTAYDAVGVTPLTANRKLSMNRSIRRMKSAGIWSKMQWYCEAWWAQNEAQSLINWKDPTKKLTKVGTPTWAANIGWTTNAASSRYNTDIPLSAVDPASFHMSVYSPTVGAADGTCCGALDAAGVNGLSLTLNSSSSTYTAKARAMGPNISTAAASTDVPLQTYNGQGHFCVSHLASDGTASPLSHYGFEREKLDNGTAPAGINDPALISVCSATNSTTRSVWQLRCFTLGQGLTTAEREQLGTIVTDMYGPVRWGEPVYTDAGYTAATVNADVIVYGLSLPAVSAAYAAKRQNPALKVILVGDEDQSTLWSLGGHPAAGLGYADVLSPATIYSGLWWDMVRWCKEVYYNGGSTSTGNMPGQAGSASYTYMEPHAWNAVCRRMLDPTKTTGLLPGLDIPIYFSGGVSSVAKTGARITGFTTKDTRVFTGRVIVGADYTAVFPTLTDMPVQRGAEAAGAGYYESFNGYILPDRRPTGAGTSRDISPYDTDGVTLLPDIQPLPNLTVGQADPGSVQTFNIRQTWTQTKSKLRPIHGNVPPVNYNPKRYEVLARLMALTPTFGLNDLFSPDATANNSNDINNGKCAVATNLPGSGAAYMYAPTPSARRAVLKDVRDYITGLNYFVMKGGDSRVPTNFKTAVSAYGNDLTAFTDFEPDWSPWIGEPYKRDGVARLKSSFVLTATDVGVPDGQVPAKSTNIISGACYFGLDSHIKRRVVYQGFVYLQGAYDTAALSGSDQTFPVPYEMTVPDKAVCDNFLTPTYPNVTAVLWSNYRMDANEVMCAQSLGVAAAMAATNNIAVQDVNVPTLMTAVRGAGDSIPLIAPATT